MESSIANWVSSANYDLKTVANLLKTAVISMWFFFATSQSKKQLKPLFVNVPGKCLPLPTT